MMTMKIRRAASYLILAVFYLAAFQTAQAGVDETLAELNGKPSEEREKVLIDNARKEGTLTFYAATNLRDTQEVVAGFNKRYPFIKVAFPVSEGRASSTKFLRNIAQVLTRRTWSP